MKLILRTAAILAIALTAIQAKAENVALILSFENYENGTDLRGALSNHDALLSAYRGAGYRTFGGRDRDHLQLRRIMSNFIEELDGADNAVIHITGHVASFGSQSWILPSDTTANSVVGLEIDGVSVDFLLELLARKPGQSVLFLGMSERNFNNIPGAQRGVSAAHMPDGVLMISGEHTIVSRAVLRDFLKPDTIIIEALSDNRRRLTVNGDIPFDLVLAGNDTRPRVSTAEEIEAALRLTRNQRRAIQADLTLLGYRLGSIDGVFGNATRQALLRWQRHERLAETGFLTRDQIRQLDRLADAARRELEGDDRAFWARSGAAGTVTGLRAYLSRYPEGLFAERARDELASLERSDDVVEWDRAARVNTLESYQRYLRRYPDGAYNRLARVRIQEIEAAARPDPAEEARLVEERLRLDNSSRLLIELRLAGLGYRVGSTDGAFDAATRRAIRQYQQDRDMPATGYVTSEMIRQLLLGR